jgi:hypothetical protein
MTDPSSFLISQPESRVSSRSWLAVTKEKQATGEEFISQVPAWRQDRIRRTATRQEQKREMRSTPAHPRQPGLELPSSGSLVSREIRP